MHQRQDRNQLDVALIERIDRATKEVDKKGVDHCIKDGRTSKDNFSLSMTTRNKARTNDGSPRIERKLRAARERSSRQ